MSDARDPELEAPQREDLKFDGERFIPGAGVAISYEHWLRYFFASQLLSSDKDVLDVACGEGYGSAYLSHQARSVVGFDADARAVAHARAKYSAIPRLTYHESDIRRFFDGCDDERFDVVVAFEVIEHIDADEQGWLLDAIRRVLRPDGIAIISTPDKLHYTDKPGFKNPFHVHEYYREEFEHELTRRFEHVRLMDQALFTGCALVEAEATTVHAAQLAWTDLIKLKATCQPALTPTGDFLVAVVGKTALPDLPSTVMVDFSRKLIGEAMYQQHLAMEALQREMDAERQRHVAELAEAERRTRSLEAVVESFRQIAARDAEAITRAQRAEAEAALLRERLASGIDEAAVAQRALRRAKVVLDGHPRVKKVLKRMVGALV